MNSDIYKMFHDPEYYRWEQQQWGNNPLWIKQDNTIYEYIHIWRKTKQWLMDKGMAFAKTNDAWYMPVATIEDGVLTGYIGEERYMAEKVLKNPYYAMQYPNLYWVDIESHPYPLDIRRNLHTSWLVSEYQKECHKLVNPDTDPMLFFTPKSLLIP